MSQVTVRRIRASDASLLRTLRLRSLADAPEAFGQTPADAASRDDGEWLQLAKQSSEGDRRAWFLAMDGRAGVGVVQGRRRPPHDLMIFSMWVDPDARRSGVGRLLIETLEGWAREWGAAHSVLWVFAANESAIRFYQRLGFSEEHGTEDAQSGEAYGALAMSRPISPIPSPPSSRWTDPGPPRPSDDRSGGG